MCVWVYNVYIYNSLFKIIKQNYHLNGMVLDILEFAMVTHQNSHPKYT